MYYKHLRGPSAKSTIDAQKMLNRIQLLCGSTVRLEKRIPKGLFWLLLVGKLGSEPDSLMVTINELLILCNHANMSVVMVTLKLFTVDQP